MLIICYADDIVINFLELILGKCVQCGEKGHTIVTDWLDRNWTLNIPKTEYIPFDKTQTGAKHSFMLLKLHTCNLTLAALDLVVA